MTKKGNRTIAELIEAITQHGEAVPTGYRFDPRRDPALEKIKPDAEPESATETEPSIAIETGDEVEGGRKEPKRKREG